MIFSQYNYITLLANFRIYVTTILIQKVLKFKFKKDIYIKKLFGKKKNCEKNMLFLASFYLKLNFFFFLFSNNKADDVNNLTHHFHS